MLKVNLDIGNNNNEEAVTKINQEKTAIKQNIHYTNIQNKILKIEKRLPQIIIPADKVSMFIDWWNSDIRFEKSIPNTFNEGYMIIDNTNSVYRDINVFNLIIKKIAKDLHTTYREVEKFFTRFIVKSEKMILHFKFLTENSMFVETYDTDYRIMSNMEFAVGEESEPERIIDINNVTQSDDFDKVMADINFSNLAILVSCLWYIATTTRSTRYIYENKTPIITGRKKGVVQVSDTKFITTPIYDMKKVKTVTVNKLTQRKKGWTYSHSFEVHGHYRHYKDGKVVFIKPFIKGKNKEFKSQKIIIEPKNQ